MFGRRRKSEKFGKARFVTLAYRTVAIWFNPFGMFLAQGIVYLLLKLNVRLDRLGNGFRALIFTGNRIGNKQTAATARA